MSLKRVASMLMRVSLGLAVVGTSVFAVGGCDLTTGLQGLINGLLPTS
jgi:hypothetical protein